MEDIVKVFEMIPNQQLAISSKNGDTKDIVIYSHGFFDIEISFKDKIEINLLSQPRLKEIDNLLSQPRVKKIIYG